MLCPPEASSCQIDFFHSLLVLIVNAAKVLQFFDFSFFFHNYFVSLRQQCTYINYASIGILDLCRQAGATVEGMGFLIEKEFQGGRHLLQLEGIPRIESLAIIESLTDSQIKIKND